MRASVGCVNIFSVSSKTVGAFADPCNVTYSGPRSPVPLALSYDVAPYGQYRYGSTLSYTSKSALDADFPATNYTFHMTGKVLAGGNLVITLPADSFPPQNPQLTGTTYSRLMHSLKTAKIELDRKILSDIAIADATAFSELVKSASKTASKSATATK